MRAIARVALLGAIAVLPACFTLAGYSTRPRTTADTPGGFGRLGAAIDSVRSRPDEGLRDRSDRRPLHTEERRVCRTGGWPRGWLAVAYEPAEKSECPGATPSENSHAIAIIRRLDGVPFGALLEICADQAVPKDWAREWNDAAGEASGRCAGVSKGGADVVLIRRVR